jgi:hypothetical protein
MTEFDETLMLQFTADNLQKRLGNIISPADVIKPTSARVAEITRKNADARADYLRKQLSELAELGITPTAALPQSA